MARGSEHSGGPPGDLTPGQLGRWRAFGAVWLIVIVVVGCSQNTPPPALPPAPTLAVVTATPGPPPVPTMRQEQRYVVREGDTLSAIAARFDVTEEAILEKNNLANRDMLFAGQEIVIPPAQP